jgi:hypothetical protein
MAGLASLASRASAFTTEKRSHAYLLVLRDRNGVPDEIVSAVSFQYFPESLSDSKATNWQAKDVPGASLPMYQWVNSGERSISFTAVFASDVDPFPVGGPATPSQAEAASFKNRLRTNGVAHNNVDVRSAVAWLRRFMLPTYSQSQSATLPPPKLILYLPNSGIGIAGGETALGVDQMLCVMTQCEVSWEKFFPSGNARVASVNLGFSQIPQYQNAVRFPQAGRIMERISTTGGSFNGTVFLGYSDLVGGDKFSDIKLALEPDPSSGL